MKPVHIKIALAFAALVLISYFILIITGDRGLMDLRAMRHELNSIRVENKTLEQKNMKMYRKIKRLKNDPAYTENIARQELKMIGKDEVVFKFKNKDDTGNK